MLCIQKLHQVVGCMKPLYILKNNLSNDKNANKIVITILIITIIICDNIFDKNNSKYI